MIFSTVYLVKKTVTSNLTVASSSKTLQIALVNSRAGGPISPVSFVTESATPPFFWPRFPGNFLLSWSMML